MGSVPFGSVFGRNKKPNQNYCLVRFGPFFFGFFRFQFISVRFQADSIFFMNFFNLDIGRRRWCGGD